MTSLNRVAAVIAMATLLASAPLYADADTLPAPEGPVILSVTGSISVTNAENRADFDREMLDALPQHEVTSFTDWTDGPQRFEGVRFAELMERLGARGERVVVTALNDYSFPLPVADFVRYGVLLATRQNGEPMPVREKGPIWVIYPQDEPASGLGPHNDKMVWQVRRLHVE